MARLSISMTGGGPWGFRLYGGDSDPLVVAKLRKRSKAADAGLQEGDAMLAINRYSCANMTHQIAMALVDQSQNLNFEVLRGASDRNAVNAAIQTLGSEFSAAPRPPQGGAARPSAPAPAPAPQAPSMVNGFSSRQTESYQDGPGRQVKTETSTQQFGSTTITKVRKEVSQNFPPQQQQFQQQQPRQGAWAPNKPAQVPQPKKFIPAPPQPAEQPMDFEQKENFAPNKQQHGYVPPSRQPTNQNMFKISKVQTQQPKAIWTPSFIPDLPQREGPHDLNLMDQEPEYYQEPEPQPQPEPQPDPGPVWQPSQPPMQQQQQPGGDYEDGFTYGDDGSARRPLLDSSEEEYARMMLEMIMHGEMGPESPNTIWKRKKKIYADSAFYDDPDHKYPTIEEQIKMARKVALSLEAPANQRARGHKMFMKRKEKAHRWVAGELQALGFTAQMMREEAALQQQQQQEEEEEEEEKYYAPDPWQNKARPHTWKPSGGVSLAAAPPPQPVPSYVPPPPAPDFNWNKPAYKNPTQRPTAAQLPFGSDVSEQDKEEKSKAMSMEEFEKMRMFESKVEHNKVPPGVSFKLAEDLQNMRGKGAKLFAKRKAKADQWVVGGEDGFDAPEPRRVDPDFLNKVTGGLAAALPGMAVESPPVAPLASSEPSRPRLQEMINPPKAAMTPWDAMASYGDVDRAFSHLDTYFEAKKAPSNKNVVAKSLKSAANTSFKMPQYRGGSQQQLYEAPSPAQKAGESTSPPPFQPPHQPPPALARPQGASSPFLSPHTDPAPPSNHQAPPRTSPAPLLAPAPAALPPSNPGSNKLKPWASSSSLDSSSSTNTAGGYRPIKFKAPTPVDQQGVFDAGPPQWRAQANRPLPEVSEIGGGCCDL